MPASPPASWWPATTKVGTSASWNAWSPSIDSSIGWSSWGRSTAAAKGSAFRRAALLVAPSYRENFGNAIAEAMAAGLPVVVSERVGIAPDIAEWRAGLIVPIDPAALAGALGRLLADPAWRAAMGHRGRELVRARYSGPAVAAAMLTAYARAPSGWASSDAVVLGDGSMAGR